MNQQAMPRPLPITQLPSRSSTARPWSSQTRPTTSYSTQSRPTTARPQTAQSNKADGGYVVAVIEGRGVAREVGIAALDRDTGHCVLVQLGDCQTYVRTLHQLHIHNPCMILVPDTFLSVADAALAAPGKRAEMTSLLVECLREEFPHIPLEVVARKYWNDTSGLEFVIQLCVEDDERAGTLLAITNKYYALSAVCALFKHAELKLNTRFAASSLRIRYLPVEGTMMIDPETVRNLELVGNMTFKKSPHSLFGTMNFTYTAMAARLLRNNIISPITVEATLNARLDVVEGRLKGTHYVLGISTVFTELVQSEDRFTDVRAALRTLNKMDFDKLIVSLAASETKITNSSRPAAARVTQMLDLRNLVKNLPLLCNALAGSRCQLLRIVHDMLSDDRISRIHELIQVHLNEDLTPSKGGLAAVNTRVYAVKANHNRLLDVARETYKENVGDIYQLNRALSETHELPLTLVYQDTGFVFCLKKQDVEAAGGTLPKGFINAVARKGKWLFSSLDLKKMNARMKDALDETLLLSDKIIQDLVDDIVGDIGALYKASEAVALLDTLWSFAHISIMRNYVRPEFTGTLAIKSGRHPMLETIQAAGTLVPNDVYCDDSSSFQIVQGPNMSGKSTYLRQIGLLTIMAMCGSFVPAEYASFRLHDALLTRLSNDDDMEKSLSTFANEMATSAMIIGMGSSNSLLLIDELGRGTSPREGVGISHAIAEELVKMKAFVFFATHFAELSTTLSKQPSMVKQTSSNFGLIFQYKILDGAPEDSTHYGLDLARLADLPEDVLIEAKRVATTLETLHARTKAQSESNKIALRRKALLRLRTQLTQAYEHSALPNDELLAYVGRFQKDIAKAFTGSSAARAED